MTKNIIRRPTSYLEEGQDSVPEPVVPRLRSVRSKKTLDTWISERLRDTDKEGSLTTLTIEHLSGNNGTLLHTKHLGQQTHDAKDLADLFRDVAETHCQDLPNNHSYRVYAFYGKDSPEAQYIFTIAGKLDTDILGSEGPTKDGLLSHGMAWVNRALAMALSHTQQILETQSSQLQIVSTQNTRLVDENIRSFEALKHILIDRETAQQDFQLKLVQTQHDNATKEKWIGLIPGVVNRLTGKEVFPVSAEDTGIIEAINKLPPEKIRRITDALSDSPEVLALLASRLNDLVDKQLGAKHPREEKILGQGNVDDELERLPPTSEKEPETSTASESPEAFIDSLAVNLNKNPALRDALMQRLAPTPETTPKTKAKRPKKGAKS